MGVLQLYKSENHELASWRNFIIKEPLTAETAWPLILDLIRARKFEYYAGTGCGLSMNVLGLDHIERMYRIAQYLQSFFQQNGIDPSVSFTSFWFRNISKDKLIDRLIKIYPAKENVLTLYKDANQQLSSWKEAAALNSLTFETAWPLIVDLVRSQSLRQPKVFDVNAKEDVVDCALYFEDAVKANPELKNIHIVAHHLKSVLETKGIDVQISHKGLKITGVSKDELIDKLDILDPSAQSVISPVSFSSPPPLETVAVPANSMTFERTQ